MAHLLSSFCYMLLLIFSDIYTISYLLAHSLVLTYSTIIYWDPLMSKTLCWALEIELWCKQVSEDRTRIWTFWIRTMWTPWKKPRSARLIGSLVLQELLSASEASSCWGELGSQVHRRTLEAWFYGSWLVPGRVRAWDHRSLPGTWSHSNCLGSLETMSPGWTRGLGLQEPLGSPREPQELA